MPEVNIIAELNKIAARLPQAIPDFTPVQGIALPTSESELSPGGRQILEAWKPLIEKADVVKNLAGSTNFNKRFEVTAKLVLATMLTNVGRIPMQVWHKEATLAGTDIPSYARQVIGTILRAYPKLFALQLFGVVPFSGPDGRVFFRDFKYDGTLAGANYTATSPNVAVGDRTDDLTKFNPAYFKVAQGVAANRVKTSIASMVVSVDSYRIVADWYYEGQDDYQALYGGDLGSGLVAHMGDLLSWVTDRTLIDAALAAAPAGNNVSWTAQPAGYATLSPSEKRAYDETIWSEGILRVITKVSVARVMSLAPDWAIADATSAERLLKLSTFVPSGSINDGVGLNRGAIRDIGVLSSQNIRVLVDPQMTANTVLFGVGPSGEFSPGIKFCPYRPLVVTNTLENPGYGSLERGVYTRFGVAKPDTGTLPASSQLGDVYGKLTIA